MFCVCVLNFHERTFLLVFNDAVEHACYRAFAEIMFTIGSFGVDAKEVDEKKNET